MKHKIKEILDAYSLKQKELAFILDVSPAAVCRWLKGDFEPEGGNRQLIYLLHWQLKENPNRLKHSAQLIMEMRTWRLPLRTPRQAIIILINTLYGG